MLGFILLFVTVQHKHMLINYRSDGRVIPKTRLYSCALGVTRGMRAQSSVITQQSCTERLVHEIRPIFDCVVKHTVIGSQCALPRVTCSVRPISVVNGSLRGSHIGAREM